MPVTAIACPKCHAPHSRVEPVAAVSYRVTCGSCSAGFHVFITRPLGSLDYRVACGETAKDRVANGTVPDRESMPLTELRAYVAERERTVASYIGALQNGLDRDRAVLNRRNMDACEALLAAQREQADADAPA